MHTVRAGHEKSAGTVEKGWGLLSGGIFEHKNFLPQNVARNNLYRQLRSRMLLTETLGKLLVIRFGTRAGVRHDP